MLFSGLRPRRPQPPVGPRVLLTRSKTHTPMAPTVCVPPSLDYGRPGASRGPKLGTAASVTGAAAPDADQASEFVEALCRWTSLRPSSAAGPPDVPAGSSTTRRTHLRTSDCHPPARRCCDRGTSLRQGYGLASRSRSVGPPDVPAGSSPTRRTRPRTSNRLPPARRCCDRGTSLRRGCGSAGRSRSRPRASGSAAGPDADKASEFVEALLPLDIPAAETAAAR